MMMVGISEMMMMTEDADCVRVSMCVEVLCQPKRKLVEMMCRILVLAQEEAYRDDVYRVLVPAQEKACREGV
jgi:hypothetical protein